MFLGKSQNNIIEIMSKSQNKVFSTTSDIIHRTSSFLLLPSIVPFLFSGAKSCFYDWGNQEPVP